ncbi:hypothetical protein [Streptomyces sp. NPDC051079]|uniref:hypothetical protein n=1 Tax=Streptomyces sp. NPDC051079 TaxID=3155043 RepID=UPI00344F9AB6
MEVKDTVSQIFKNRVSEYFSESPIGFTPAPALYSPALPGERVGLEGRFEASWDDAYRDFLAITDGMDGFNVVFLGVKDWTLGGLGESASTFLEDLRDIDLLEDEGIDPSVQLVPVAVNSDISVAVFMGDFGSGARFWWTGEGDGFFFADFVGVLRFAGGLDSGVPRKSLT